MGLRDAILDAVSSAVTAVGDIAESVTYISTNKGEYDVYTGQNLVVDSNHTINAIISFDDNTIAGKGSSDMSDSGFTGEITALFASKGLTFTPKTDDKLSRNGEAYIVTDIKKDPVGASYSLKLRKLG
jgi:hypothetical protein